jgi:hypothetical protein
MNKKNSKKKKEKAIALSQIFILTVSILAFAYFVGDEFKFVGAEKTSEEIAAELVTRQQAETAASTASTASAVVPVSAGTITSTPTTAEEVAALVQASKDAAPEVTARIAAEQATQEATKAMLTKIGIGAKSILGNAIIAAGLYFGIKFIGGKIFGEDSPVAASLAAWTAGGYLAGSVFGAIFPSVVGTPIFSGLGGFLSVTWGGVIGAGVGLVIWFFSAQNERIDAVQFSCSTWQPKTGGADCEKCNKGQLPCTTYKCKSLGESCEFIDNEGTGENLCVWNNRNDITAPIISSWSGPLKEGYSYNPSKASLPADSSGTTTVTVEYNGKNADADKCIPPFTIVKYGISLNKPAKCRMDTVRMNNFTAMRYEMSLGDSVYNHTLTAFSPGLVEAEKEGISIPNGGEYEIFIRCESQNGISNVGTFAFKFCAQNQPDTTAPTIPLTEPLNGMPISTGTTSQEVKFYTNKPADCKWSHSDEDYDKMANKMTCAQSITEIGANMLYKCSTTLNGLKDSIENKFYVKCKSYPANEEANRVINAESYVYTLIGTSALVIDSVEPLDESTIKDATESVKTTLKVKTSAGYKNGEAWCYYNETSNPTSGNYVLFANTESYQHSQELWLAEGSYDYSIKCCDLGGNCKTESTEFEVETDSEAPLVTRIYNEGQELKVVTNEEAKCVYDIIDCSYDFESGIKMTTTDSRNHYTSWDTESIFYVKCKDKYENSPLPDKCSVIAHPFSAV